MFRFAAALFDVLLSFPSDQPCAKEVDSKLPPTASLKRPLTANSLYTNVFGEVSAWVREKSHCFFKEQGQGPTIGGYSPMSGAKLSSDDG